MPCQLPSQLTVHALRVTTGAQFELTLASGVT